MWDRNTVVSSGFPMMLPRSPRPRRAPSRRTLSAPPGCTKHRTPSSCTFAQKGSYFGDTDASQSELFDSFFQLFRGHFGMLQSDRRQARKPIGMRRAPFGELLILNVNDPSCEIPVCPIPPAPLMTQHLDINARLVEDPQAFRA